MAKILVLSNNDAGLYKFRKELLQKLVAHGYEVYLCLPDGQYIIEMQKMGCRFIEVKVDRRGMNPITDIKLLLDYFMIIRKLNPDLLLTYTIKPNIYGGIISSFYKKNYVTNITGLGTSIENSRFMGNMIIAFYRIGIQRSSHIFFQNKSNLELFTKSRMISNHKCSLIPGSGVNLDEYEKVAYPNEGSQVKILFVGRIMRSKGVEELFCAIERIKAEHPKIEFSFVGPFEEDYRCTILRLSSEGKINYLGALDDVRPEYSKSWAVVLPSYHEGTSNVLLEAAATGRPVISTNVAGCIETFDDNVSGFCCEPKNSESLREAIMRFIELPYIKKVEMGNMGRQKVERLFDRNVVVNMYLDVIERLFKTKVGTNNE